MVLVGKDLQIGAVARELGVSTEFLRTLERQKRMPIPRRNAGGRRLYSPEDLALLRLMGVGSRPRKLKHAEEVLGLGV